MKLKSSLIILGILLWGSPSIIAQSSEITFQANELQQIAQQYTGEQLNWPLIVELATHNSENNSFTLNSSDVLRLQNFGTLANEVKKQQKRLQELIGSGATIFAPDKLEDVQSILGSYQQSVQNGNLEEASEHAEKLPGIVDQLENTLLENRLVDVQAQITKKEGEVDKRQGLLGSWEDAYKGDLLKELDGLRTMMESFANLAFTDGSTVIIEPQTEAVIRKSRIDKLNESADTEITLENGSLLAKLSASGKSKSNYILNAGPSRTELKSQNFYAEAEGEQSAKLTNYDGVAMVSANDITITIAENEGTIVEEGADPLPPVKLLPAPELVWTTQDTIIYREQILFSFDDVENAVSYRVQYSNSPNFDENVTSINTSNASVQLEELPLGTTYVRVQATDDLGLRGPHSETTRIIRNVDNKPPPLFIDNTRNNLLITLENTITISGVTEPRAKLRLGDEKIQLSGSGQFSVQKQNLQNDQTIRLTAEDNSGNQTVQNVRIIRLTEDALYNLNIQGASGTNPIVANRDEITISGNAYPGLEVEVTLMDIQKNVQTDSRGRWGVTLQPVTGKLVITFKNAYSGQTYLTKTYPIEVN